MPRAGIVFFFSSRRRHTRLTCDWSSDVCSSDLHPPAVAGAMCGMGLVCNGAGACVGCVDDSTCVAPATCGGWRSEERRVGKEGRAGGGAEESRGREGGCGVTRGSSCTQMHDECK